MTKMDDIEKMTKTLGGTFRRFSQSDKFVKGARADPIIQSQITDAQFRNTKGAADQDKLYVGGMCHTMALYWIVARETGGLGATKASFIDWIYPSGRADDHSPANMDAISTLVIRTVQYKSGKNEKLVKPKDEEFFRRYGISPAPNLGGITGWDAIEKKLTDSGSGLFMISLHGSGGHACAASTGLMNEVCYFDPNYGEASLPKAAYWPKWWDEYKTISGYEAKYTKQEAYEYYVPS